MVFNPFATNAHGDKPKKIRILSMNEAPGHSTFIFDFVVVWFVTIRI